MDPSEPRPSPRRELQGPRPTPLRVSRDSHKIKKPPVAPQHHHHHPAEQPPRHPLQQQQQQHPRDPVIIYTVSPKIIHTKPSEFMTLVQRLTGPNSSSSADAELPLPSPGGALSPAARIASFEKSASPHARTSVAEQFAIDGAATLDLDRPASSFPGILSPMPASLLPISPNLFSPSFDLSFLLELSPVFPNKNTINNNNSSSRSSFDGGTAFLASPGNNLLSTPTVPSPGAFWDLLSQFPD